MLDEKELKRALADIKKREGANALAFINLRRADAARGGDVEQIDYWQALATMIGK